MLLNVSSYFPGSNQIKTYPARKGLPYGNFPFRLFCSLYNCQWQHSIWGIRRKLYSVAIVRENKGGLKMKKISWVNLKYVWNLFTCSDPGIVLIMRINMLSAHNNRLCQLVERDDLPTQTLKCSLQLAYTWSHEIDAGVLVSTMKTLVYQEGSGIRQYLMSKNVPKLKHISLISYKRSFISVISVHFKKIASVDLISFWISCSHPLHYFLNRYKQYVEDMYGVQFVPD